CPLEFTGIVSCGNELLECIHFSVSCLRVITLSLPISPFRYNLIRIAIFIQKLNEWLPFYYLRKAVQENGVALAAKSLIDWFQLQYAPYEPYARCLYNKNKVEGLIAWYKQLGFGA
ncbi:MAG TPA: hypothetical protein V6D16_08160, partial [Candidatus Obscuribacterales bacterium]